MIGYSITGKKALEGDISISRSKNAALPIIAACILTEGKTNLYHLPCLSDINIMCDILRSINGKCDINGRCISIFTDNIVNVVPPRPLMNAIRASFLLMGPMLARFGRAMIPMPGGCNIGKRPVDLHLKGMQALGAEIETKNGIAYAKGKLTGSKFRLDFPSVGATENIIMAATGAKGTTSIINAAKEPEIVDLCNFLRMAGANIKDDGTDTIIIEGGYSLKAVEYVPIPDRIETGTYMIAASAAKGKVILNDVNPNHNTAIIEKLKAGGIDMDIGQDYIRINPSEYRAVNIYTQPYPGFPTDLQAPMMVLNCLSDNPSCMVESMFENRYTHIPQLKKLGANIELINERAVIKKSDLVGCEVEATDLRAGAALVIAGLCAQGETFVKDPGHIKRGYDSLSVKLNSIGADISLIPL